MRHFLRPIHPHHKLQLIVIFFVLSWILGTVLIHHFEREQGWSYFDALYFTIITTATIGFGDLVPHTIAGKSLTMCYAILYVPLFLYTMNLIFQTRYQKFHEAEERFDRTLHDTGTNVKEILDKSFR